MPIRGPSKIKIKETVLKQNTASRVRFNRRQEAAEMLKQITMGKKSMRYHTLNQIENQIQREYQAKIGIVPTVSVQKSIVKDGNVINIVQEVQDSERTVQHKLKASNAKFSHSNMNTLYNQGS